MNSHVMGLRNAHEPNYRRARARYYTVRMPSPVPLKAY